MKRSNFYSICLLITFIIVCISCTKKKSNLVNNKFLLYSDSINLSSPLKSAGEFHFSARKGFYNGTISGYYIHSFIGLYDFASFFNFNGFIFADSINDVYIISDNLKIKTKLFSFNMKLKDTITFNNRAHTKIIFENFYLQPNVFEFRVKNMISDFERSSDVVFFLKYEYGIVGLYYSFFDKVKKKETIYHAQGDLMLTKKIYDSDKYQFGVKWK